MKYTAPILVLGLTLATGACGSDNAMGGSIGESFALDFDEVRIRKQNDALIVEYVRFIGSGENKNAKIVADLEGLDQSRRIKLRGEDFLDRFGIDRVVASRERFPDVMAGKMSISGGFDTSKTLGGSWDCVFVNGRTLHGSFRGDVVVVPTD